MQLNNNMNNVFYKRKYSPATFFGVVFLFVLSLFFLFTSCEEHSFVGLEVLPSEDRFGTNSSTHQDISTSTWKRDSILAIRYNRSLLGTVEDPVFGRLESSFITQVGIQDVADFGTDPLADSLVLYLRIDNQYTGATDPQEIIVYELEEHVDYEYFYYSNTDPREMTGNGNELTVHTYMPAEGDTLINIPITDPHIQDKLLSAPDSALQTVGNFISYFKGIYVTSELPDGTGDVYTIDLDNVNSKLSLFYNNAEHRDTTLRYDFVITERANRINLFEHDFTEARFYDILEQPETEDTLYYIQGAAGVMGRLDFNQLHAWRDSMPVSINSARLVLPVDEKDHTVSKFSLPPRISLLEEREGHLVGIPDMEFGARYFDGTYNAGEGYYSVNITSWVQDFIGGKREIPSLYVSVVESGINPHRAVMRGGSHPVVTPRLEINYVKH